MTEHTALIYVMVAMAAADSDMTDNELLTIGNIIRSLPIFRDYDQDQLPNAAEDCAAILTEDGGFDTLVGLAHDSLPPGLRETAYVLACDVAAADGKVSQEEIWLLEMLRHGLTGGRLPVAAIERAARARFATG
jgi:tellurite resistance protein